MVVGQTLVVVAGRGLVQGWGETMEEIHPGDVIMSRLGERYWPGAAPDRSISHLAIQEPLEGKVVDWMERVGDTINRPKPRT